jgi:2'-5' RNA ligase
MLKIVAGACASVAEFATPFEMRFHWVARFRGSGAIVLWNDNSDGNEGIMNLGRLLCAEYARRGLKPPPASKLSPHLTLLYDEREFHTTPIAPISFMVNEIALVLSEVGATKYHPQGRWQLTGKSHA